MRRAGEAAAGDRGRAEEIGATPADINAIVVADTGLEGLEHQRPELVAQMHDLGVARWGTVAEQNQLPLGGLARSGAKDVTLSGGCALNVLANTRVAALPQVERLCVQPTAGDNGLPIGAAALGQHFLMGQPLHAAGADAGLRADPYRGVALEIDVPLPGRPMPAAAAAAETAPALAGRLLAGEVIGMATGRCEVGPRSLGHRSVLAYPNGDGLRDRLNRLKARE